MPKTFKQKEIGGKSGLGSLVVLALVVSMIAFGCTTYRDPGTGGPVSYVSPAGSMTTTPAAMPGTMRNLPATMVSSSVDAIAILKANEAFQGKYLGPADPAPMVFARQPMPMTGQLIPASLYANPQLTVNSSISSPGFPVIVSGAGEPLGGIATGQIITAPASVSVPIVTGGLTTTGIGSTAIIGSAMGTGPAVSGLVLGAPLGASASPLINVGAAGVTAGFPVGTAAIIPAGNVALTPGVTQPNVGLATVAPVRVVTGANGAITVTNLPAQQAPVRVRASRAASNP